MIKKNYSLKDSKMPLNGEAVRMLLTTRGETLTHVCKQLGWSNSYLSHLTLGYTLVRRDNLLKLADYLCVLPTQIMKARLSKKDIKLLEKNRNLMKQAKQKTKEDHTHDLVIEQPKSSEKDKQLELFNKQDKQGQQPEWDFRFEDEDNDFFGNKYNARHHFEEYEEKACAKEDAKERTFVQIKTNLNLVDTSIEKVKAQLAEVFDSTARVDALLDTLKANQETKNLKQPLKIKMADKLDKIDTIAKVNVFLRANGLHQVYERDLQRMIDTLTTQQSVVIDLVVNSDHAFSDTTRADQVNKACLAVTVYGALIKQLKSVINKRGNKND